jgi:hypothetical protein
MNAYEKVIQESLENIQVDPSEALRNRVMRSANYGTDCLRVYRRRFPVRAAVIAAIITVLTFTTAFAYGNEIVGVIRQLMFGDSIATQVVGDNDLYVGSWGVMNRDDLIDANDYPLGLFDTLEEARQVAPFPIREPTYLPDNITGLRNVGVWRVEIEDGPWMHFVVLSYDIELKDGGVSILQLRQTYAGPDAYFVIENVSPIERVVIGNSEAVLISEPDVNAFDDGAVITNVDTIGYSLYWLSDGIAYELSARHHDGYTMEVMIRIAESIR